MARTSFRVTTGSADGRRGKIGASIFVGIFLLVGLIITVGMVWAFVQAVAVWSWDEVPCFIESSEVVEGDAGGSRYRLQVAFSYEVDGRRYVGDRLDPDDEGSDEVSDVERLAATFAPGTSTTCRVDPNDPGRAYLRRPSLWFGLFVFLPLLLVAVGGGGLYMIWRREPGDREETAGADEPVGSISEKAKKKGIGCGVISVVFLLAGLGFLAVFLFPAVDVIKARGWNETPCEILESWVESHTSSDGGPTYSVEVLYRYEVDGREYRSSRYRFFGGSSSGYDSKREVVDRLPPGTRTVCYVNPEDPHDAVLDRGVGWEFLFALLPLTFVAIGGGGLAMAIGKRLRKRRRRDSAAADLPPGYRVAEVEESGDDAYDDSPYRPSPQPLELEPKVGPVGKLAGLLLVNLFWNGLVGVFVFFIAQSWKEGNFEWFGALILTPFVVIGLLLLIGIPYQILALANPRPRLTLTPGAPPLGGGGRIDWRFTGATGRLQELRLTLEAREEASYRRGTDTVTDRETFFSRELIQPGSLIDFRQGSVAFEIPAESMHSFEATRNKVVWSLKLQGSIRFWPDVSEELTVRVTPPERAEP